MTTINASKITKNLIIGGTIALLASNFSTVFARDDSPVRCTPYPLCKLKTNAKIEGNTALRLLAPQEKVDDISADEKSDSENKSENKKEESIEK